MPLKESDLLAASILIVDDQEENVHLLTHMLQEAGYTAVSSTTDPRATARLHAKHRFDLILLDLQMPGMDGFQVMEQLKCVDPSTYLPVLVLTGQTSLKVRALQSGAKDFVGKPFEISEVQTRIRNMLEVRLLYKRIEASNRLLEQTVAERTAELRESEARFRSLVELASDWYWEQDETGRFTKISGPALEMLGVGEAGSAQSARWNASERALLDEQLATRQPFLDFVYSRVNADGSEQYLQTSGEPKFDESGRFTGYRGIGMDVTERMQSRRTETHDGDLRRFRNAMDATSHAIFLLDRSSMRFIDVNAGACRMFGYSRDELLRCGPGNLAGTPDDNNEGDYDQLISGAAEFGFSRVKLLRKDGTVIEVEVHRQATRTESGWMLVEVVRDLAEVK